MRTPATVIFYFDPISPYAWLASKAIPRLQAAGLQIEAQPVLFAGLLNAHGHKGPAEIPAKRDYTLRDVMRLAAMQDLPFVAPPGHPFNPLPALRMCCALPAGEERNRFACAVMAATWEQGWDISQADILVKIAETEGFDGQSLLAQIAQPEIKQSLLATTNAAIAKGVFGVPSFIYDGELFWGADRIAALLWQHSGKHIDEARLQEFLQRAPLAQRKQS